MTDEFGKPIQVSELPPEDDPFYEGPAEGQESELDEGVGPEEGQPDPKEPARYAGGKLVGEDALEQAYINIMDKLGEDLDQFTDPKELEKAYLAAEKRLSRRKVKEPKDSTPPVNDLEELKSAFAAQNQQMQQMAAYLQHLAQGAQQAQAQQPGQSTVQEPVDPAALLDEFYADPQKTLAKIVSPMLQTHLQELVPQYTQRIQAELAPLYQNIQMQRVNQEWQQAVKDLKSEIADFENYHEAIAEEINKDQGLVAAAQHHPEKAKFALRVAYQRVKAVELQQQGLGALNEQQKQRSVLQKQAAKMGSSRKVLISEKSPEEIQAEALFGADYKRKGIWG